MMDQVIPLGQPLKPQDETQLAEMIRAANGPLMVQGGKTRAVPGAGTALDLSGLSGITLYEPGALTLVAKAGTPVAEIEQVLATENQMLAFEPMDARTLMNTEGTPTIGGAIAVNSSGPRRIQVGAARDFTLGVRFVDGQGNIIKNGGRVMKNVTGYDLVKLMCGAYGTLGVLTEVSLKVLPVPETCVTLMLRHLNDADAVRAMSMAMQSPYDVSGAAYCSKIFSDGTVTMLRVEGFEKSVAYRIERLKDTLAVLGAEMQIGDPQMSEWVWDGVRNASLLGEMEGDVWHMSCRPSEAPELTARSGTDCWYYDWAGGRVWFVTPIGHDLRAHLGAFEGHATLVRADPETRAHIDMFQPEQPALARIAQGLRKKFDPRGLFNPGLMGPNPTPQPA